MLTKLLPEQIAAFWDIIKYAIEESLPPIAGEHPDRLNRILTSLLCSGTECWVSYNRQESNPKFEGVALTKILYDDATDTKSLLIYCIYGYDPIHKNSWLEALRAITKYAKSKKCSQIVAYTEYPYIIKLAKLHGGDTRFTFLSFNVDESVQKLNKLDQKEN